MRDPTPIRELATPELIAAITGYPLAHILNKLERRKPEWQ